MGVLTSKRISAFTLIESVIAIIVILICFWLSTMIYLNIIRSDSRMERLKAFAEVKQMAVETNRHKLYFDEEIIIDSLLVIKRTIEPYKNDPHLKVLNIEAFNANKRKMGAYKQIIIAE